MGQDPTTSEAWSGQNIGGPAHSTTFWQVKKSVTDVSAMSPDMLVIAYDFSPLNIIQTCFPGRTVDSP